MNFLLHQDYAWRELPNESARDVASIGSMIPDFWRMASRAVRPMHRPVDRSEESDERVVALLDGVDHHLAIDRWFHRSQTFVAGERDLRKRFFETKTPKLLLFAHPAWEMCLDGALLRERGLGHLEAFLGAALERAEPALARAADIHHFEAHVVDAHERMRFDERMRRIVAAAKDGTLFADYAFPEGIARRLAGMRSAFGFDPPGESELASWARALEERVALADSALDALQNERASDLATTRLE